MFRKILSCFTLPLLLFFLNNSSGDSAPGTMQSAPEGRSPGPDIVTEMSVKREASNSLEVAGPRSAWA